MSITYTSERPSYIEQLRAESRGLPFKPAKRKNRNERVRPSREDAHSLFTVENGNRWMELARREPEAKMLLGELWHQGELCMMFADTNIGKSILAVQIGESIARGQSIAPFACQALPASVLYIDFELSRAQFGLRYSKGSEDYIFSDNFFRAQYNFLPEPPLNVDENELLIAGIEYKLRLTRATVLIIDNITCLRGGTENSAVALALMKSLKALKNDYNLSILVLAHTPKRRNATQPISADDLHGSKLLVNFADSAFAIGKSTADNDLCYIKQIKQRNTRQRYGDDNVCLCRIQKPGAFLHFTFEGFSAERHHLLSRTTATRQEFAKKVAALSAAGHSQREISNQLGISPATVNRFIRCADAPMTNVLMTNDQKGGEGFPEMESLYEPQICDDLIYAKPMSNNQPAYGQNAQHDSLPGEGWEGVSETDDPYGPQICEEFPANPPMTDDQPTNNQKGWEGFSKTKSPYEPQICDDLMPAPPPMTNGITTCGQIDALLTPELLAHILQTTPGNSVRGKAGNSLNEPNSKAEEDDGGHKINN